MAKSTDYTNLFFTLSFFPVFFFGLSILSNDSYTANRLLFFLTLPDLDTLPSPATKPHDYYSFRKKSTSQIYYLKLLTQHPTTIIAYEEEQRNLYENETGLLYLYRIDQLLLDNAIVKFGSSRLRMTLEALWEVQWVH